MSTDDDRKARLKRVLELHRSYDAHCFTWSCSCGIDFHDAENHQLHLLDAIADAD